MNDWQIVLLHTKETTLLKRAFEAAFPGRVVSLHVPALGKTYNHCISKADLLQYFRRYVFDSGLWKSRVLTVYGDGNFHHWTYALTRFAIDRRHMGRWTYLHFDQHRDDWGSRDSRGQSDTIDCASFVDQLAHDNGAIPFMVGPDCYPRKDIRGYTICKQNIPIYHNFFTQELRSIGVWPNNATPGGQTGLELPAAQDLRETPTDAYLSFDLDLLSRSEIVTNYDQNDQMTLRRICQILDKVRRYKRVFSADILGFPDWNRTHALSALTMVILARKIMGMGVDRLLAFHSLAKQKQAGMYSTGNFWKYMLDERRQSPIEEGELMETLRWTS